MVDEIDKRDLFNQKKLVNKWVQINNKRKKQGKNLLSFDEYKRQIKAKVTGSSYSKEQKIIDKFLKRVNPKTLETAKVAAKAGVKSAISPKKAFLAGTGVGGAVVGAGMVVYDAYKAAKKHKKKIRQESGTKHLDKAYGGKVNTYRSPRRTAYND